MMVIVPRIATVSCFSATPFIYGIRHESNFRAELLHFNPTELIRSFTERRIDLALMPGIIVPLLNDARVVTEYCVGALPGTEEYLLASHDPYVESWKPFGELPSAFAVWVAHSDVEAETVEALQHALTYGLEHNYEAILESHAPDQVARAYEELSQFDYIFDNQKDQALKKCWDSGLKVAPHANPG